MLRGCAVADFANIPINCIFCEGSDLFGLPAVIADVPWPVCNLCASAGRAILDEGVIQPVLHCLHLVAMEIGAFAEGYACAEDASSRKWLYRIQRQFARGAYREVCPCKTCMGEAEITVVHYLHARFGMERETFADTMPLNVLTTMKDSQRLQASDGSTWKAAYEVARRMEANALATRRGKVGRLARAASPASVRGRYGLESEAPHPAPCICAYCQRGPGVDPDGVVK